MAQRIETPEGAAIRICRVRKNFTQAELARRAGVTVGTVVRIERGGAAKVETFRQLAAVLGPLAVQTEIIAVLRRRGQDDAAALAAHAAVRAEQVRVVEGE